MKTALKTGLAFAFMVAFLESVIAAAKWWRGDTLAWWEWGVAGALPVLVGVYLRYFSVVGRGDAQCLDPPERRKPPAL